MHTDTTNSATSAAGPGVRPTRSVSDWAGCIFFAAFALLVPFNSGKAGLLLLPPMMYELVVAVTFLIRGRARRSLQGIGPRAAAYGATFFLPLVLLVAQRAAPNLVALSASPLLRASGACLWLFGSVLAFWPVWHLRRSFSIEPAARELATGGPYRLARHPIYATQILIYAGILMMHATPVFAAAVLVWLLVLRVRVSYEERVLRAEFADYESYRSRVGAFWPWVIKRPPTRAEAVAHGIRSTP